MQTKNKRILKDERLCCAILAGGKATRMGGADKSSMKICGSTFLEKLTTELSFVDEILISVSSATNIQMQYKKITDKYINAGPLGAIASVLNKTKYNSVFFIPCDTPLITANTARKFFTQALDENYDAIVAIDENDDIHPLCAIYKKSCVKFIEYLLENKIYKVRMLHRLINVKYILVNSSELVNINTPHEYRELINETLDIAQ